MSDFNCEGLLHELRDAGAKLAETETDQGRAETLRRMVLALDDAIKAQTRDFEEIGRLTALCALARVELGKAKIVIQRLIAASGRLDHGRH